MLIVSLSGASPWSVLAQGISLNVNYSIGIITFIISIVVLMMWIPLKQKPGMGTILNALIIAAMIDLSINFVPSPEVYFANNFSYNSCFNRRLRWWNIFGCKFRTRSKRRSMIGLQKCQIYQLLL